MLLVFFLLFFCVNTGTSMITQWYGYSSSMEISPATMNALSSIQDLSPLQAVATPDYPVAEGQTVNLHCSALTTPAFVKWTWQHLQNLTWQQVGSGSDLALTEPEQSGLYRCCAETQFTKSVSHNLTVYIIAMWPTVGVNLGIAAFVLSILALITLTILGLLVWQRLGGKLTIFNTADKGCPGPEKAPKGGFPQAESDGDVYMNYSSNNQAYTNLDLTNMTGDNTYSSLS